MEEVPRDEEGTERVLWKECADDTLIDNHPDLGVPVSPIPEGTRPRPGLSDHPTPTSIRVVNRTRGSHRNVSHKRLVTTCYSGKPAGTLFPGVDRSQSGDVPKGWRRDGDIDSLEHFYICTSRVTNFGKVS